MIKTVKEIASRIILKHDTEANWNLATDFIPKQGEIIVYDIDDNYFYERIKIGDKVKTTDGWTTVIDIVRYTSEPIITYNIDAIDINETIDNEENDTFIANGIVVHNAACPA